MEAITLEVQKRDETGKKMRAMVENKVPAVIYGNNVKEENLWIDATTLAKAFALAGTNIVISLVIDGAKPVNVLIYDFQTDPVSDSFTHVDFYVVNMKEKVDAEIPLVFVGVSAAVKELGGTLIKNNDTLVVRALPADLPHEIKIDISKLATFEDSITVADIAIDNKVEIALEDEATIASVTAPRTEEEMAELDSEIDADVSKIEGVADVKDDDADGETDDKEKTEGKTEEK